MAMVPPGLWLTIRVIVTEWVKILQDAINKSIDSFRKRLRRVTGVQGGHV